MKINRLVVPLTAFAAVAALTACGGWGEESSTKPVTVWMYPVIADEKAATAYWSQIEKDSRRPTPTSICAFEQQPWSNRDQKLATAFSGGKGPDVAAARTRPDPAVRQVPVRSSRSTRCSRRTRRSSCPAR